MYYRNGYYRTFKNNFPIVFEIYDSVNDMSRLMVDFEEYAPYETKFKEDFWKAYGDVFDSLPYSSNKNDGKVIEFWGILNTIKKISDDDARIDFIGSVYDWTDGNDC